MWLISSLILLLFCRNFGSLLRKGSKSTYNHFKYVKIRILPPQYPIKLAWNFHKYWSTFTNFNLALQLHKSFQMVKTCRGTTHSSFLDPLNSQNKSFYCKSFEVKCVPKGRLLCFPSYLEWYNFLLPNQGHSPVYAGIALVKRKETVSWWRG